MHLLLKAVMNSNPHILPPGSHPRPRAFSLIELLVVIGIIVALIAIVIPTTSYVREYARRGATSQTMSTLATGLDAYYNNFNAYPNSNPNIASFTTGSQMLAQGLMGFLDFNDDGAGPSNSLTGADVALGFRTVKGGRGKIYGPYATNDPSYYKPAPVGFAFYDGWGRPILYYKSTKLKDATLVFGTDTDALFVTSHNPVGAAILDYQSGKGVSETINSATGAPASPVSGSSSFFTKIGTTDNTLSTGTVAARDSYLLISAGKDGLYFTADDVVSSR